MLAIVRRSPPTVAAFVVFFVTETAVGLARSPSLWDRPWHGVAVAALLALWLSLVVRWRQRWAWLLLLLTELSGVLSPAWGEWHGALVYAANLATAALLLSSGMRRWVDVGKRRHRTVRT
jgi:hypothetical protein